MYTRIYIPVLNSITSVGMSTKDHNLNNKSQRPRKTHKANNRQGQSSHSDLSIERRTQCKYSMKCLNISVKIETNPAILKAQRAKPRSLISISDRRKQFFFLVCISAESELSIVTVM